MKRERRDSGGIEGGRARKGVEKGERFKVCGEENGGACVCMFV